MAIFGEVMPFVIGVGGGLIGLRLTMKFLSPRGGLMHLVGFLLGMIFFGGLAVGATVQFFDPPLPALVKVSPMAIPGQGPYAPSPIPSPYK
jgi:hypothetical protein